MKTRHSAYLAPLALVVGLGGCAADRSYTSGAYPDASSQAGYPSQVQVAQTGYVDRIEVVQKGASKNVAGTVIGAIVGGLIGTQIGGGSGRAAATIAGAAGGAVAGNTIEGRRRADNKAFRVSVRLDNGAYHTMMQEDIHELRTGDRVRVDGNQIQRL